ncbi:metalloprotease TIKI2 [Trichonephila inaurata madagascariensis]|uniref:Metalloprotease TIKI homolog n=1 Tax=Trichonephila inaurata madagascariensis TaxID=2747483 RepID=A0A8X6X185_9ARAC|nr:metalloprotease TIKI2 [Trichonephila inaurata madagascariensis]
MHSSSRCVERNNKQRSMRKPLILPASHLFSNCSERGVEYFLLSQGTENPATNTQGTDEGNNSSSNNQFEVKELIICENDILPETETKYRRLTFSIDLSHFISHLLIPNDRHSSFQLSDSGNASDELLSKNINQYFRQELIEKRNARMAHRVLQLLRQYPDESFFFAFGTGHFLGNGSVLDYIRDGGYEVEQVSPDAKIRNFHDPVNFPRYFPINSQVSNSSQRREEISKTE